LVANQILAKILACQRAKFGPKPIRPYISVYISTSFFFSNLSYNERKCRHFYMQLCGTSKLFFLDSTVWYVLYFYSSYFQFIIYNKKQMSTLVYVCSCLMVLTCYNPWRPNTNSDDTDQNPWRPNTNSDATIPVGLNLSVMVQYFSLPTNQQTIFFSLTFQRGERSSTL
jgi:hypothetical protein